MAVVYQNDPDPSQVLALVNVVRLKLGLSRLTGVYGMADVPALRNQLVQNINTVLSQNNALRTLPIYANPLNGEINYLLQLIG